MSAAGPGWETLFWALFDRSSNPIAVLDERLLFVALNEPALAILGRTRGYLVGRSLLHCVVEHERDDVSATWRTLRKSMDEVSGTRTIIRPDGTTVAIEYAARVAWVEGRLLIVYVVTELSEPAAIKTPWSCEAEKLTPREREVVTLIALGEDTAGVAAQLTISPETARTHVRNAMQKLGVHTRAQLVAVSLVTSAVTAVPQME